MHNYGHWKKTLALLVMSALSLGASSVDAMPEGGVIRSGEGAVSQNGREMTIRQDSGHLAMDWTNFNVGKDETVRFQQPGKDALALNRVTGNQQSVIDGSLLSNGHVLLVNPNGVVIGKNASIDVGGLVASTAHVKDNFMKEFGNSTGAFTLGGVSDGKIINEGTINAEGGLVALHAAKVENSGTIKSNGGSVLMAATDTLTLTPDTDGKLNFTVDGKVAEASALNKGAITADGGTIVMTADSASDVMGTVVNNEGTLQARTLRKNEKGQILLEGNDKGQVEVSGTFDASGEGVGQDAGNIKVIGQKTIVHDGTNLLAKGDVNGGKIETSGDVLDLGDNLNIDAKGVNGKAGEWLLDPLDVIIADEDPTTTYDSTKYDIKKYETDGSLSSNTTIGYYDPVSKETADASATSTGITWIKTKTIKDLLDNRTDVTIQAAATNGVANITVNSPITKESGTDATLTMDAMRNITINKDITSKSGKLNVFLNSDTNGNKVGAVIINANINTNGGNFTSTSGGNIVYTPKATSTTKGYDLGTLGKDSNVDSSKVTVGTYFGNVNDKFVADGSKADRSITTKGGSITLNGEVAIGLAGGTLNLDSTEKGADGNTVKDADGHSIGGSVTVTGIINSGNSYATYIYGTDAWNDLIKESGLVDKYLAAGTVPSYHYKAVNYVTNPDGTYKVDANGNYETTTEAKVIDGPHYTYSEANTEDPRWTGNGQGYSPTKGTGWTSVEVTGTSVEDSMTVKEFLTYYKIAAPDNFKAKYGSVDPTKDDNATIVAAIKSNPTLLANLTADINDLLSVNWFVAKNLAQGGTKGGSTVGDTYLATLTTILENSLSAPESSTALFVGARGSGVLNKKGSTIEDRELPYSYYGLPDDPLYSNGMYWVTGPEGKANDGKGTQFYSNVGSDWSKTYKDSKGNTTYNSGTDVYGFVNWSTWPAGGVTRTQPDNSGPFLTVGYGANSQWDDSSMAGGYGGAESAWAKGFVQEKNLVNSSLNIKAGNGEVKLQGDIGKAKALDTVNIESTGAVTIGTDNNNVTNYYHGTVYVDHGLYISGNGVTVGGEIHSGESPKTDTSTTLDDKYKDSVTIESAGNIEVHGITSNTYNVSKTDGTATTRGGKISLTSTGDKGKITLGAGVDYDGNATAGTLAAASTEKGAVVIDAQGSQGSLVNSTDPKYSAITTGTDGTWQVYVNSPSDYGTSLGSNLISGTNAQWTAKSTANTTVTTNSSNKMLTNYTDTYNSSNKFIFQVTPVITISGGYASKTYGDSLSEKAMADTLTSKATYKYSQKNDIDVTSFKNFNESDYLTYVTSSGGTKKGLSTVSVSSDGAKETATRTKGNEKVKGTDGKETNEYKKADDDNRAFYVMDVTYQDGVKTLNGYDKAANDGEVEIKRKTLNISTDGTQTYGNTAVTNGKPSYDKTQLVNGDTLGDIQYTIATDGSYAASKGSNDTAHAGSYEKQYLTSSAEIKASDDSDASANYEVTGSGTITVKPADLVLQLKDVSTTYGQKFDEKTYGYNQDTDYLKGLLKNGDDVSVITDNIKNDAIHYNNTGAVTDADKNTKGIYTANAGANYAISSSDTISLQDYKVTFTSGKSTVNKAVLVVDTTGKTRTYGDVTNVANDINVDNAASFHVAGGTAQTVNGDSYDDILKEMNLSTKSDALVTGDDGKVKTGNANTDPGYDIKAAFKTDLTNYTVTEGVVGKEKIEKADLTLTLKDVSTTYGQKFDEKTYGYKKDKSDLQGLTNGDDAKAITDVLQDSDFTYVNGGAKSDPNNENVKTQDAGSSYKITGTTSKTLDNYNIKVVNPGNSIVSKKAITVKNEMNQIYGEKDSTTFSEIVRPDLANGDKLDISKDSKFTISLSEDPNTPYNEKRKNRDTADVGEYADSLKYSGGGIVHSDGTDAYENYDVTIKGIAKVHPKDIYTEVIGKGSTLNDLTWTILKDPKDQMANGDSVNFTYKPGNLISYDDQIFDVNSFINGTQTYGSTTDVDPYGKNYIFHSTGIVQLTFNPIVKPDVWAHSGGYRPRNKIETSLPVFRVEDAKVGQYGTYGVEHREDEDKLVLSATGMRLPEPDQVPDEERTFTTTLSTEEGSGTFKLEYNGVSLKVHPQDKEAEEVVRAGDKTKNVSLSEKALYVGYTEMGLDLIDLKGVYIYFN
ncbi:filamentous hemagglutinin N-terminal domain-containing protein [uncultured Dialister sp.]|uniref:two-partner secretion domain-containing protein n=1 Tax=uncultured Dialister sp. TaxID=278064 RepID=UPI0025D49BC0|nr:filamentous hemagglutinin N-terminal domain-containing protein [uncultured Dialister sp.]